jgi:glycosyltransferase involved in cell wall biosynthesis
MGKYNMHFFALAALGAGLSGSDRIFIEFARRWSKEFPIDIHLWKEGYEMCRRQTLSGKNINFKISNMKPWSNFGFSVNYFARILEGVRLGFKVNLDNSKSTLLYSASDFWMDSLPCFILKLRFPRIKWIATWYQTAPNPFKGFTEGDREKKYRLNALFYWLSQLPIKPLISGLSDFVLVNNEEERHQFSKQDAKGKVKVVLGAVDVQKINKWILKRGNVLKIYDAVFQGRLHAQKGPVELVEIWKKVVDKKKDAKLAVIGDGPLKRSMKIRIKKLKLENNIKLFGYVFDGSVKYNIFSKSKIVVHPAFYDSGGMAAAEAMAFGLPCVGFNLKSYRSYYPKGMLKVRIGDLKTFAENVLELLSDQEYRNRIGKQAFDMINKSWSWDQRAKEILEYVKN